MRLLKIMKEDDKYSSEAIENIYENLDISNY